MVKQLVIENEEPGSATPLPATGGGLMGWTSEWGMDNLVTDMGRVMYSFHRAAHVTTGLTSAQWRMISILLRHEGVEDGELEQELHSKLQDETSFMQKFKSEAHPGLSQRRIQEMLGVDAAGITRTAKQLEQDGWIRRESDPNDNRYTVIRLTEQGRKLGEEMPQRMIAMWQKASSGISRAQMEQMRATLHLLADNLGAIDDTACEE